MKEKELSKYYRMLSYMRPAGSRTENKYIKRYIDSVKGMGKDIYGNRYIVIGDIDATTMFSSHTDTVHREEGKQKLLIDDFAKSVFSDGGSCLGADDTTGNFIMLHMIKNKVPGLYVFHRDEEIGGLGSEFFSRDILTYWPNLKRCIAFDRKSTSSVITHQMGKCCSEDFAVALCTQLSTDKRRWESDDSGVFTDSANYVDMISECTNLSVGYYHEHTKAEYQDTAFLRGFIDKLLRVDWEALPTVRDLSDQDMAWWDYGYYDAFNETPYSSVMGTPAGNAVTNMSNNTTTIPDNTMLNDKEVGRMANGVWDNDKAYSDIQKMVWSNPELAITTLCEYYGCNQEAVLWKKQKKMA